MIKIPECEAKNIPSNFEILKKLAQPCLRCGIPFVRQGAYTQHFCPECRGELGSFKLQDWKKNMNQGFVVEDILNDLRR